MTEKDNIEVVEEVVDEVIERPYTLSKLKDSDLYIILSIMRKIGLKEFKDSITKVAGKVSTNTTDVKENVVKSIGVDVMLDIATTILVNIPMAKDEIYELASNLTGMTVEELENSEFGTVPLIIYDAFSEVKNTSFFKVLAKLL